MEALNLESYREFPSLSPKWREARFMASVTAPLRAWLTAVPRLLSSESQAPKSSRYEPVARWVIRTRAV
jgi:hypothetical protein